MLPTTYENYIMRDQPMSIHSGGRGNQYTILKYKDGSEWVHLNMKDQGKERFCGFLYLQDFVKREQFKGVAPAENKIGLYGRQVIYLSKYCGELKPDVSWLLRLATFAAGSGYEDLAGYSNLREENNMVYVFDTPKNSFKESVHESIDHFGNLHDAILVSLKESPSLTKEIQEESK